MAMKFLADESCDFAVVRAMRSRGYDVVSVCETFPGVSDVDILRRAVEEERVLLTEDKDFGDWVFAHGAEMAGVVLLRFPANARESAGRDMIQLADEHQAELAGSFIVLEPGRARIRGVRRSEEVP